MADIKLMLEYTKELSVLYVEDDLTLLETTKELFTNFFKSVETAQNGQEGLDKYIAYKQQNSTFYDLVITDINMPILDGLEMAQEMYKKNAMQSILVTTAHNDNHYLVKAIELGVDGFINKPLQNRALTKALYKISQAIGDHKFVISHVEMIEELNMKLEIQNNELQKKNRELEKSFRMLDTMVNKEQLSQTKIDLPQTQTQSNSQEHEHRIQQIQELVSNDLFELKEILTEIDVNVIEVINSSDDIDPHLLKELVSLFSRYSSVLNFYNFFNDLALSMKNFSLTIKDSPLPSSKESVQNIFMLLESFIYVLSKWHEDIASGDTAKINQFDASIISDIHTITNMWVQSDEEVCDEDLDDIFDF